jgi:LysR family transcriptional regulator, glycine cleavage system transcriptional activator
MNYLDVSFGDPPLRAVRAFEATARLGTMAAASVELGISPSAVSHQLALLESFLQLPLTERRGRGLKLTDAGREYYRSVRSAFAVLRDATGQLRDRTSPIEVKLSVIPLFGTGWLIPHLPEFLRAHPGVNVNVMYANHRNYLSDAADLSVRFGTGNWNGYASVKVASGTVTAVCGARYAEQHGPFTDPADLLVQPLIHDQDRSGWVQWFQSSGLRLPPSRAGGTLFEDGLLARSAALAGLGVALLRTSMIAPELVSGELTQLFDHELDDGRHYYLCHRLDAELSEQEIMLREWLRVRLAQDNATNSGRVLKILRS